MLSRGNEADENKAGTSSGKKKSKYDGKRERKDNINREKTKKDHS